MSPITPPNCEGATVVPSMGSNTAEIVDKFCHQFFRHLHRRWDTQKRLCPLRNAGTRYLVLIRNIQGNGSVLANDMKGSLFPQGSPGAERLELGVVRQHVVHRGGRRKYRVTNWLKGKGF